MREPRPGLGRLWAAGAAEAATPPDLAVSQPPGQTALTCVTQQCMAPENVRSSWVSGIWSGPQSPQLHEGGSRTPLGPLQPTACPSALA